jgi:outer membrane lipoprotein-sorting protein
MRLRLGVLVSMLAFGASCAAVPPPASRVPTGQAALDRLRATGQCEVAIQASAKIDQLSEHGRIKGDLLMFAAIPARMRMDAMSPFNSTLLTLTSDGKDFALADFREKRFLKGAASACNIARLTTVPVPPHALVSLLRGQAPLLKHDPAAVALVWSSKGYYVVTLPSTRDATEELHLEPRADDRGKPWSLQRMRLLDVTVRQYGEVLYHAELSDHVVAPMAKERVDALGTEPPLPPSGPVCDAEIPKRIHLDVPGPNDDVAFRYQEVTWNPPLPDGIFTQVPPDGMPVEPVDCN